MPLLHDEVSWASKFHLLLEYRFMALIMLFFVLVISIIFPSLCLYHKDPILQAMQLASPGYGQLVPRLNFLMQGFLLSMIGEAGDPPGWSVVAFRS